MLNAQVLVLSIVAFYKQLLMIIMKFQIFSHISVIKRLLLVWQLDILVKIQKNCSQKSCRYKVDIIQIQYVIYSNKITNIKNVSLIYDTFLPIYSNNYILSTKHILTIPLKFIQSSSILLNSNCNLSVDKFSQIIVFV